MQTINTTAAASGLCACHACGLVSQPADAARVDVACPRCGARLHPRKPNSAARTWALLIAALVLYIPANFLPVMETGSLFGAQQDTIMSGVVYLWVSGSWPLAVLVFLASIVVPLAKLITLTLLMASVQLRWTWLPRERTRLYRMIEFIGRWSMLDKLSYPRQSRGFIFISPSKGQKREAPEGADSHS